MSEDQTCSNCRHLEWPYSNCDGCAKQTDENEQGNWEPMAQAHSPQRLFSERKTAKPRSPSRGWSAPTTYRQRFAEAVALLCKKQAPEDMIDVWLAEEAEDGRLQEFAIEHGPTWAQGIVLLDAAAVLASTPTEGVDHDVAMSLARKQENPT